MVVVVDVPLLVLPPPPPPSGGTSSRVPDRWKVRVSFWREYNGPPGLSWRWVKEGMGGGGGLE